MSSKKARLTRWVAGMGILMVVLISVWGSIRWRLCEFQLTSTGANPVEVCRSLSIEDPPVIAFGLVLLLLAGTFYSEVSGFGFSFKRQVEQELDEVLQIAEEAADRAVEREREAAAKAKEVEREAAAMAEEVKRLWDDTERAFERLNREMDAFFQGEKISAITDVLKAAESWFVGLESDVDLLRKRIDPREKWPERPDREIFQTWMALLEVGQSDDAKKAGDGDASP